MRDEVPSARHKSESSILRTREHRRRRLRRHGRRAYIRSAYSLPSLATLGNAICGFGAMYVATLSGKSSDPLTNWFYQNQFVASAYLIFVAMLFDALDGRLARFTRHTTDFGGQLDSLADVISFGAAPALLALQVVKANHQHLPSTMGRLIWAIGAFYMSCAAIRLARFNVSNEHGEQHHYSFLGVPSPAAGGTVAALILMQQDLAHQSNQFARTLSEICIVALPLVVLGTGLLMVSAIRYPHLVNRYLRGKRSLGRLLTAVVLLLATVVAHRYTVALGMLGYMLSGLLSWGYLRTRARSATAAAVQMATPPEHTPPGDPEPTHH